MTLEEVLKKWKNSSSTQKSKWVSEFIFDQPVRSVDWIGHFITHKETGYEYRMPFYTDDISAAWLIFSRLIDKGAEVNVGFYKRWDCSIDYKGTNYRAEAETASEAICKAALLAVLEDINLPREETTE